MSNNLPTRRKIFIKKAFQARFVLGAFAVILLSGLCSALLIYWITADDLQAQSLSAHFNISQATERLGASILIGNVVAIIVAGAVAVISVLYASHRIAGPLHRFEALCEAVGSGDLDDAAQLRENDQLQELAGSFSAMVAKLRHQRGERSELIVGVHRQLSMLREGSNLTSPQQEAVMKMAELLDRLES
jgi:methyl-accepting chemotaxis protein